MAAGTRLKRPTGRLPRPGTAETGSDASYPVAKRGEGHVFSASEASKQARIESIRRAHARPEVRARIGAISKASWADPESRARRVAALRRARQRADYQATTALARAKGAQKRRSRLDDLVAQMYADYQSGLSLSAVARKYGRGGNGAVAGLFEVRGLALRHDSTNPEAVHLPNGCFAAALPLTEAQIQRMVDESTKLVVPAGLKLEWRKWSLERRGEFVRRLRERLKPERDCPELPYSSNVEPFDYGSPHAHAIAAKLNEGTNSQTARVKIDPCSQGVIFRGMLWFWSPKAGYMLWGPWSKENGRPSLHHILWEEANGRPVPSLHVVAFADGNPNNLDPSNLKLRSRTDLARCNLAIGRLKKSRAQVELLLRRAQKRKEEPNGIRHEGMVEALRRPSTQKHR